ncbi:MAG: DUF1045 domain-containing protein [Pseudomonadota bacterium]
MTSDQSLPRYAIYYAPSPQSQLWALGSRWLGRDASTNELFSSQPMTGFDEEKWRRFTEKPAHYGFHGTLTSPFELADTSQETDLRDTAQHFASAQAPFLLGLEVAALGKFIALRPSSPSSHINTLHTEAVRRFFPLRAPLSSQDIERRRKAQLTPKQDAYMLEWGYPYIFDEFRFHMTLTARIADEQIRSETLSSLKMYFADVMASPQKIDGIALFKQDNRNAPFTIIERYDFQPSSTSP